MPLFDLPADELAAYRPERDEPEDFDAFWSHTLGEQPSPSAPPVEVRDVDLPLTGVQVQDLAVAGYGGQPVRGWVVRPAAVDGPLPVVVQFIGYGGGRGLPFEHTLWPAAGFVHVVMDTRGQGTGTTVGATVDTATSGPHVPGFMTSGIDDPHGYYYRRVLTDAVRAVTAARSLRGVDPERVFAMGGSQGGGITLAVAGLVPDLAGIVTNVPFLCHYRRATEITKEDPYGELVQYLASHRTKIDQVFRTLSYFDGLNFAARASAPALFSVGLMDEVCPPSTVFAAYNHYAGPREIAVYPYNGHEGGEAEQTQRALSFVTGLAGSMPATTAANASHE